MADKDIIKTLCNERFNELFSDKISNEQKEIVISAFIDIIVMIYDKFDITITKDNYVLSNNDYYEVLMLLFPFIDDWNKLKEVENLEDLFKTDKFNKFVINNQMFNGKDIKTLSLTRIIDIKKEAITKTLIKYYHSFYPNWYTIFPIPIQEEIDNRINNKKKLGINDLTEGDWLILLNLYQYYLPGDNVHILNNFKEFDININILSSSITIDKNFVQLLFNKYVLNKLEIIHKKIKDNKDNNNDMLMLMMMMNGGKMDFNNPMFMYMMMSKSEDKSNLLPLMMLMNQNKSGESMTGYKINNSESNITLNTEDLNWYLVN